MDRRIKTFGIGALAALLMVAMLVAPAAADLCNLYTCGPDSGCPDGPWIGCCDENGDILTGDGFYGTSDIGMVIRDNDKDGVEFNASNPPYYVDCTGYLCGDDEFLIFESPGQWLLIGNNGMGIGAFYGTIGPNVWDGDHLYVRLFNGRTIEESTYYGDSLTIFSSLQTTYRLENWNTTIPIEWTYTISGYTDPAADTVKITNLNKPAVVDDKPADYIGIDGFYNLTLNVTAEVEAGDMLQITACEDLGNYESNCNVSDHVVVNAPGEDTNVNLTLNHYCKNYYPSFPFSTWEEANWSGAAVMEMLIDNYRDPPDVPNQTELNETGIGYNQNPCNADLQYVDPKGVRDTLNLYLHAYNGLPYVANYGIGSYDAIEDVLHYICKWHYLGPGTAPAYGDYSNWMVIRGIHTDVKPTFTQGSYEIYGFWINDPKPDGIGENTYKTVDQWSSTYHLNLTGVRGCDSYKDRYVAVCEPPEDDDVEVMLAKPKPRLTDPITPVLAEKTLMVYNVEQLALEKVVEDNEMLKIVAAAIDGVNEELVPHDAAFAEVFAKTVPGEPMLVASEAGDYYLVPFNVPVEVKKVKKVPVAIEKVRMSGLKNLERVKRVADVIEIKPIPIEPIKLERTLVVVLVNAEDGSFKEASWVADPVKYLRVSKIEALKLALGELLEDRSIVAREDARDLRYLTKPTIELVYRDASPYYPDWKITVNDQVFYVGQDGTVS